MSNLTVHTYQAPAWAMIKASVLLSRPISRFSTAKTPRTNRLPAPKIL